MNTRHILGSVLLCLLYPSLSFAADQAPGPDEDISAILIGLERSKFSALQQRDTASLDALFDERLMWVNQNGTLLTKAAYLSALHNAHRTVAKVAPVSMTVRTYATVAIVIGIYEETGFQDGHASRRRCRFIDTWTWKKGRWVCISAASTSTIS